MHVEKGSVYSWATKKNGNRFGQLGRQENIKDTSQKMKPTSATASSFFVAAAAGGSKDSGHTLVVTREGSVYACGCDRWQQLGLGSTAAGAAGYTWEGGKLWRKELILLKGLRNVTKVAAGDDHSVALLNNGEVWTFGRGEHGQLGHPGKPFVMPPTKSVLLSEDRNTICNVRAEGNCTGTFDKNDSLLKHVGRCKKELLEQWNSIKLVGLQHTY